MKKDRSLACTKSNTYDISKSVAVINHAIKINNYAGNAGCPGSRACSDPNGLCPGYDCSSLAFYAAAVAPGSTLNISAWPYTTNDIYNGTTACTGQDPITWWYRSSAGDGGGHMYVNAGGNVGNAHMCTNFGYSGPEIDDYDSYSPPFFCRVPPGLAKLSDSCICGGDYVGTTPQECSLENYYDALGDMECSTGYKCVNSYGCLGRYQFCPGTIENYWAACPSPTLFLNDPDCQDDAAHAYAKGSWDWFVARGLDKYLGKRMMSNKYGMFTVTQGGMLAAGNMSRIWVQWFLESNGTNDQTDGYGTYISDYMAKGALTVVDDPWVDMRGYPSGASGCEESDEPSVPRIKPVLPIDIGLDKQGFVPYAKEWWKNEFKPALKDMAAQIYAYRVFETWELGRMMDAQDINRTARVEQEQRVTAQQRYTPSEEVCVAGSHPNAMFQSSRLSEALTEGFKNDLQKRGANFITEVFGKPKGLNPTQDQEYRWKEYCAIFHDPDNNNGPVSWKGACPNPTAKGRVPNGDISIEGFLLKDTIDMNDTSDPQGDEYTTAQALLKNLVQPIVVARIPDDTIDTAVGKEYLLIMQHLEAINSIATDVVASIISRRAGIKSEPGPVTGKSPGELIREIRLRAGTIDPAIPAPAMYNPSYNEIMLAMTKERFFDPQYFIRMANNIGAIKQEQTAVNAYITIQMQDIYKLQEQINALLAARASLNLMPDSAGSQVDAAPVK